ncbi:DoxX family protein [uncultured Streptomyces sp.]|uniref:DoxX family protein n=1 Tax=uncultured Streptomyces sp. TaxID=174707 RepID=UPI00260A28CF|nr:DoxX family protein [uncultured Streptomyces sp.]
MSVRSRLDRAQPWVLAVFRLVTGFLFACHGAAALFGVLGGRSAELGAWPGWYAAVIEFVGGILVMLGLGTRTAALICSGSMAYAYFTVHQGEALLPLQNNGEPSALYCWAFLLLVFTGPGAAAADRLFAGTGPRTEPGPDDAGTPSGDGGPAGRTAAVAA